MVSKQKSQIFKIKEYLSLGCDNLTLVKVGVRFWGVGKNTLKIQVKLGQLR